MTYGGSDIVRFVIQSVTYEEVLGVNFIMFRKVEIFLCDEDTL